MAVTLRHRAVLLSLFLVAMSAAINIPREAASADVCGEKEHIYWVDSTSSGIRTGVYGTTNEMRFNRRDLNESCGTENWRTMAWSAAHIRNGCCDWVEVGWNLKWEPPCTPGCQLRIAWFSEMAINGTKQDGLYGPFPCSATNGNFYRWRTVNIDGTDDWSLRVNCGSQWQTLDVIENFTHSKGMPMAETGRRGGEATGMSDRQRDLKWQDSLNTWYSWFDPDCWLDDASNWQGHPTSGGDLYYTENGPSNC